MDPYLQVPVPTRIKRLRAAVRWSIPKFARILGVTSDLVFRLERLRGAAVKAPVKSAVDFLPRLRLMEEAFRRQLEAEIKHPSGWGRYVRRYTRYNGNRFRWVMDERWRSSQTVPDDPGFVELLGGIEVFRPSRGERRRMMEEEEAGFQATEREVMRARVP